MKYLLFLMLSTAVFSSSNGIYIEAGAGMNFTNKVAPKGTSYSYDYNIPINAAIGYQGDLFRFEFEELYMQNKIQNYTDSNTVNATGNTLRTSTFFNTYIYKLKNKTITSIGLGVGATNISINDLVISNIPVTAGSIKNIPTVKASFAVGYKIDEDLVFDLKYSYTASQSYTISNVEYERLGDNTLSGHFRYLF